DRSARPLLDQVAADDAGVVRGPAVDEDEAAELPELLVRHPETLEDERAVANAVADRLGHGVRLLVDLLQHERLVAGLLGALVVPVELHRLLLEPFAVRAPERGAIRCD